MVKKCYKYLLLESIVCLLIVTACYLLGEKEFSLGIVYIPFDLIAKLLRFLSLSSILGNVFACILYAFVCLIPSIYGLWLIRNKRASKNEILLLILSIYMFYMIYMLVNPHNLTNLHVLNFSEYTFLKIDKFAITSVFYSILLVYIALTILRSSSLSIYILPKILFITASIYVIYIFYFSVFEIMSKVVSYNISNMNHLLDYLMIALKYLLDIIPELFTVSVLINAIPFINAIQIEPFGAGALESSRKLSALCKRTVIVAVICNLIINLSQLILSPLLHNTNFTISIPIIPIILALSFYIITKYIDSTTKLKEENDQFI